MSRRGSSVGPGVFFVGQTSLSVLLSSSCESAPVCVRVYTSTWVQAQVKREHVGVHMRERVRVRDSVSSVGVPQWRAGNRWSRVHIKHDAPSILPKSPVMCVCVRATQCMHVCLGARVCRWHILFRQSFKDLYWQSLKLLTWRT